MSVISNSINNKDHKNVQSGGKYHFSQTVFSQKNFDENASINSYSINQANFKPQGRSIKVYSKEPSPIDNVTELKKLNDEIKQRDKKIKELSMNYESIKKIYDEKVKQFETNLSKYYLTSQNNLNTKEIICMMIRNQQKN